MRPGWVQAHKIRTWTIRTWTKWRTFTDTTTTLSNKQFSNFNHVQAGIESLIKQCLGVTNRLQALFLAVAVNEINYVSHNQASHYKTDIEYAAADVHNAVSDGSGD